MAATKSSYAIISVGGKQYRVREGEKLLVDRLKTDEGKTFNPDVLFLGGDGDGTLSPRTQVTAKVVGHVLGDKIRIGKRRAKTGFRLPRSPSFAAEPSATFSIDCARRAVSSISSTSGSARTASGHSTSPTSL